MNDQDARYLDDIANYLETRIRQNRKILKSFRALMKKAKDRKNPPTDIEPTK